MNATAVRPNTRMQRTRSSPSALRSPLMRCPLGLAVATVIAMGTGMSCSSAAPVGSDSETIQSRCGAKPTADISQSEALCIAKLGGLPKGLKPWRTELIGMRPDGKFSQWQLWSTEKDLDGSPPSCPSGKRMVIERLGGQIAFVTGWSSLCDP